jgi:hypothetical protein
MPHHGAIFSACCNVEITARIDAGPWLLVGTSRTGIESKCRDQSGPHDQGVQ